MTIEAQIITLLMERLQTITIANGYKTSAGQRVFRNLEYTITNQERPSLHLFVGENIASFEGNTPPCLGEQNHYLQLKIEGFIDDNEAGLEAANLCADLAKLLWSDQYYTGLTEGYEGQVKISGEVQNGGEDGFIGYAGAEFTIFYITAIGEI